MKKTKINLIPDIVNPSPDYYCTWQTQLYATCDGKPAGQRAVLGEKALFEQEKPFGWAYFYEKARGDLFFVMDDSWDVPLDGNQAHFGSLILNQEKFPQYTQDRNNAEALRSLVDAFKSLGWKGLGGWVCAQEAPLTPISTLSHSAQCSANTTEPLLSPITLEDYWKAKLSDMQASGFSYWKVDWGKQGTNFAFRKMLTELARQYAPELILEHAIVKDIIPHSDVFRTYDVPAIMSIPMTMQKIAEFSDVPAPAEGNFGFINCEDEAYIAAAGGFTMGIMRHPYSGSFADGKPDMSFPALHRNLKTKMYEVIRAVRWHRIAPAFSFYGEELQVTAHTLHDTWYFEHVDEEIESWWLNNPLIGDFIEDYVLTKEAPAAIARGTALPDIQADENGYMPYCVASRNPNGAFCVATLGRTIYREYFIPKCDVAVDVKDSTVIGVFGEYKSLILKVSSAPIAQVFMQDLAADYAFDVTDLVTITDNQIVIPGELISHIGTCAQPEEDTSEPGVVIQLYKY